MQQQLAKVFSCNLLSLQSKQSPGSLLSGMQQHLKLKALELQRLQHCFQNQIKEIESYENSQKLYKIVMNSVLKTFKGLRGELEGLKEICQRMEEWKEMVREGLEFVLRVVERERQERVVKSRVEVNEGEFKRIEGRYREQIERQSNTIVELENALKNRSLSKTKSNIHTHFPPGIKRDSSPHIRSQNDLNTLLIKPTPALHKSPKGPTKQQFHQQKHTTPLRSTSKHTMNKEEVIEKIRKYQKSKVLKQNPFLETTPKKVHQVGNNKFKGNFEIPALPQLRVITHFQSPISNGFDVLVVDGKEVYKGMWKKGLFEGRGKYYSNGWVYDGEFRGGSIDGFGTLNFKGVTFIGKLENGLAQGEGTLYLKQKPISGVWRDSVLIRQYS